MTAIEWELEHQKRIEENAVKVNAIYNYATYEAVKIGATITHFNPDKPFKWDDYPGTKYRIDKLTTLLGSQLHAVVTTGTKAEWDAANEKNDELVHSVLGLTKPTSTPGKGPVQLDLFATPEAKAAAEKKYFNNNPDALAAFQTRKTAGLKLSDRVWRYTNQFKDEIEMGLDDGIRNGATAAKMARDLRQYLQEPDRVYRRFRMYLRDGDGNPVLNSKGEKIVIKQERRRYIDPLTGKETWKVENPAYKPGMGVYKSSLKNAQRLTRTEINMAYRTADHARRQQLDFIVGFEVKTSNNHPVIDICDTLKGRYPKEFKFVGWHPHCRCKCISIMKMPDELEGDIQKILNGEPIDTESLLTIREMPANFTNWVADNCERIQAAKNVPYFIADNYPDGDIDEPIKVISIQEAKAQEIKKAQEAFKAAEQVKAQAAVAKAAEEAQKAAEAKAAADKAAAEQAAIQAAEQAAALKAVQEAELAAQEAAIKAAEEAAAKAAEQAAIEAEKQKQEQEANAKKMAELYAKIDKGYNKLKEAQLIGCQDTPEWKALFASLNEKDITPQKIQYRIDQMNIAIKKAKVKLAIEADAKKKQAEEDAKKAEAELKAKPAKDHASSVVKQAISLGLFGPELDQTIIAINTSTDTTLIYSRASTLYKLIQKKKKADKAQAAIEKQKAAAEAAKLAKEAEDAAKAAEAAKAAKNKVSTKAFDDQQLLKAQIKAGNKINEAEKYGLTGTAKFDKLKVAALEANGNPYTIQYHIDQMNIAIKEAKAAGVVPIQGVTVPSAQPTPTASKITAPKATKVNKAPADPLSNSALLQKYTQGEIDALHNAHNKFLDMKVNGYDYQTQVKKINYEIQFVIDHPKFNTSPTMIELLKKDLEKVETEHQAAMAVAEYNNVKGNAQAMLAGHSGIKDPAVLKEAKKLQALIKTGTKDQIEAGITAFSTTVNDYTYKSMSVIEKLDMEFFNQDDKFSLSKHYTPADLAEVNKLREWLTIATKKANGNIRDTTVQSRQEMLSQKLQELSFKYATKQELVKDLAATMVNGKPVYKYISEKEAAAAYKKYCSMPKIKAGWYKNGGAIGGKYEASSSDEQDRYDNYLKKLKAAGLKIENEPSLASRYFRGSSFINEYLLGNDQTTDTQHRETLDAYTPALSWALNKLPRYNGATYRGCDKDAGLFNSVKEAYINKKPFTQIIGMSTSTSPSVADGFGRGITFKIYGRSGVYGEFSYYKNEKEVLYRPGSKFEVLELIENTGSNGIAEKGCVTVILREILE